MKTVAKLLIRNSINGFAGQVDAGANRTSETKDRAEKIHAGKHHKL